MSQFTGEFCVRKKRNIKGGYYFGIKETVLPEQVLGAQEAQFTSPYSARLTTTG